MKLNILTKIKVTGISLAALSILSINAHAQEKIGLQRAVTLALERNLTIKQAQFNEALTNEDLKQSRYNLLPSVSANPQGSLNFGRSVDPSTNQFTNQRVFGLSGSVNAQVVLFQGGQLRNQIIQNKILLEADRTNTAKVKNDLTLNVVTTYLSVLTNQDLVTAAIQQIDIAKLTLDRAQKNFNAGNQTLADLSQAKAQLSTAELNLTNAQNQLELSVLTLKQYMEMAPGTEIEIERPDVSKLAIQTKYNAEEVFKTALNVNPDVRLAEIRRDGFKQAIQIARGAYYPSLVLFGSAGTNYSDARSLLSGYGPTGKDEITGYLNGDLSQPVTMPGIAPITSKYPFSRQISDNFNQSVGLTLQIPIFNRFTTRTAVRKAKITYENAEVTAQLAKNNLSKIIYQAVWDVQAAEKRLQSTSQTYEANKEAYNVILQRYNVGLVNSLDLNTSLTNLNKAQFDMIEAKYQLVFRSKVIDYYLGNPITL
ncbi:TolC family protein [Mucilaginibacter gynuensis]|uniref:TolC family protein n=1 Tax=Mucilaginibacter gynuensis TaxID=1302236 RepID=A0ABP8HMY0_9SPHI